LSGYVSGIRKIDAKIVKKCADELKLPGEGEDAPDTNQETLAVNVNEKTPFTRDPDSGAEQQKIKVDKNAQINILQKQPKSILPIVIVVFAIWIATVLSLYKWFSF
jgi:hypothetical protein